MKKAYKERLEEIAQKIAIAVYYKDYEGRYEYEKLDPEEKQDLINDQKIAATIALEECAQVIRESVEEFSRQESGKYTDWDKEATEENLLLLGLITAPNPARSVATDAK